MTGKKRLKIGIKRLRRPLFSFIAATAVLKRFREPRFPLLQITRFKAFPEVAERKKKKKERRLIENIRASFLH